MGKESFECRFLELEVEVEKARASEVFAGSVLFEDHETRTVPLTSLQAFYRKPATVLGRNPDGCGVYNFPALRSIETLFWTVEYDGVRKFL